MRKAERLQRSERGSLPKSGFSDPRGIVTVALLLLAACAPAAPAVGGDWYVDFESGNDAADGRSQASAWKRAPGDKAATGRASKQRLVPGDRVIFRAGVPYRGAIVLADSGSADRPITYTGLGWGEGLAVIDGADPVRSVRPCQSAADCGGAAQWQQLSRIEFTPPETARAVLYGEKGPYWLSQLPELADPFFRNERDRFARIPLAQLDNLKQGILVNSELAAAAQSGGGMELAFWVQPNLVVRRPLKSVDGDALHFDAEGLRFYENRDGAVALNGSFAGLGKPGSYVQLRPGVLVARLRPEDDARTLSIGSGRTGIDINDQSNIVITGFHFRNQTASPGRSREGRAVTMLKRNSHNIEVSGSLFGPALLQNGMGIVQISGGDGFRFVANRIENIAFGSGFRATSGKPRHVTVKGNVIRHIGATGIAMFGVTDGRIIGNVLADIRGNHGNGITAYLGNHGIRIEDNCVVASRRPLTFHGDPKTDGRNDLVIRHNIFISSPDGQAAINSWGKQTRGVVIEGNLAVGPKLGILLGKTDEDVVVRGNDAGRIADRGIRRKDWAITDNRTDLTLKDVEHGQFSEESCHVPGTRIAPVTRWQADD